MTSRSRAVGAATIGAWLLAMLVGVGTVILRLVSPVPVVPNTFGMGQAGLVAYVLSGVTWVSIGTVLTLRRAGSVVGPMSMIIGVGSVAASLAASVTSMLVADAASDPQLARIAAWLTGLASFSSSGILYLAMVFPTGRGHTPRWDLAARLAIVVLVASGAVVLMQAGPNHLIPSIDNPPGGWLDLRIAFTGRGAVLLGIGYGLVAPVVGWSLLSRYRAASPVARAQLRWFMASIGLNITALLVAGLAGLIADAQPGEAPLVAFALSGMLVPVAIGMAILRYRLYEIDRIISRTIGWAVVTGLLVAAFAGVVVALQGLLGGVTQGQTLAVAASTLAAFALFQPVRRRVQAAVDRRFDRARYDGQHMVDAFAEHLRNEVDLTRLRGALVATADQAVRPVGAGVWLRGSGR